ncbi:nuclear factor of activated T-cells 5a isoform X2 [Denticeps clupeoides]|uniref:nuclear factor of activated T-cells 5a isoform X2 n=1 Tax=Denticeps clupeoides TaxID=299321 RepID=UPI0010A2ADDB|nr:nuclear factor of activated T-cells 5-like isoform X2 [Denticeps clupeoides]
MPSDFISLLTADIDLNSPKSLYSKESVYDLLPKELQLPPSAQQEKPTMSQKSGGEAGPPPPAALASDAASSCTASSSPVGGNSSALPGSSCPSMLSAPLEQASRHLSCPLEERAAGPTGLAERLGVESVVGGAVDGGAAGAAQQSQITPSKRRTVLNISPPPEDLLDDSRMSCQDEPAHQQDSEQSSSIWMDDSASNFSMASSNSYNDNTEVPRKSRKRTPRQRPGPKPTPADEASMDVFDADSAKAPHFVLSQLSSDTKASPKGSMEVSAPQKGGILSAQFPQKSEGKELKILVQPETQHRARYLTEGSRGSVKDRTQQGFPTVKLDGVTEPVVLQVFVANDTGRVKPHGFYQACRVTGRNTTACKEVDIEGTTVIEVNLEPSSVMTLAVDCVGILKLRNADVEARIGVAGSKKKSTRARLAFRVNIPRPDGSFLTLQTTSSPILCTQPAGVPEILKKSLHSCSVMGGEEVFIIGKNFLKGTKVVFQETSSDESGWQAEAEIDMELFHQNHLIVKVPPYRDLAVTSPVSVGICILTNAGRTHDLQPFTYTPQLENPVELPVKSEVQPSATPCSFQDQIKAMQTTLDSGLDNTLMAPPIILVKREEVTPMEVSSNTTSSVFKPPDILGTSQQILEVSVSIPQTGTESFPSPVPLQSGGTQQQTPLFSTSEPLSSIQKQDTTTFQVSLSEDATVLQPVPPQVPQQFLRETPETLSPEDNSTDETGMLMIGMPQIIDNPPSQSQQGQVQVLMPQDGVAQLERAVRQLQAGGSSLVQQVLVNSVLYSTTTSAENLQQHVQENMNSLQLDGNERSIATQQQQQNLLENLQQQQQKALENLQHQQTVMENLQQQQQVLENIQLHQQALENLQQQRPQEKVLENVQQQNSLVSLQHQVLDDLQQHQKSLENLQQQQQHHQNVLENLTQQYQSEILQPQIPMQCASGPPSEGLLHSTSQQQQQQAALFQQPGGLLTIQTTSFLQQPPSHPSPPQQLFQTPSPMAEAQNQQAALFRAKASAAQNQVQALFPNTITMLTSDQQQPSSALFLAQGVLQSQLTSDGTQNPPQQQIAFLTPMHTSASDAQAVSLLQGQLELSTPMEQQQSPQLPQQPNPPQTTLFQGMAALPSNQPQQEQQQAGLLFCASPLNPQELPSSLLFSGQPQVPMGADPALQNLFQDQQPMQVVPSSGSVTDVSANQSAVPPPQAAQNAALLFSQASVVSVAQQEPAEPMSFQDQSSVVGDRVTSSQASLFQDQQAMQVVPSSGSVSAVTSGDQPTVNLFLSQSAISALQGGVGAQELPQAATTAVIFAGQSGVPIGSLQNTATTSTQQAPESLFQSAISGPLSQPGPPQQPGLFLFEIPNECSSLMNPAGPSLSEQLVSMGHPGTSQNQGQLQNSAQIQNLLEQSGSISDSQNMRGSKSLIAADHLMD